MRQHNKVKAAAAVAIVGGLLVSGCKATDPAAEDAFLKSLGNTSVTVFPAFVRDGVDPHFDASAATAIGEFLENAELADASVSDREVPITGPWHANQARMLRESAEDFATYLRENPVENEYALLPEYLFLGGGGVGGIHCYIVDGENRLAFVVLLNSHWDVFSEANPQTVEDCTSVMIEALRDDLKPNE